MLWFALLVLWLLGGRVEVEAEKLEAPMAPPLRMVRGLGRMEPVRVGVEVSSSPIRRSSSCRWFWAVVR